MLQYNPTVTGSLQVSGDITGTVNGINITGLSQSVSTQLINVQVSTGSSDAKFETLSGVTSSALTRLTNIETKSASVDISISNINSITASNIARLSNLETKSSSVDISLSSINSKTGSYATTGSNQFYGTQVFSGSVFIANDLIVQGSSSIQYISASSVSIGTNIVQLNTATPSIRFAGLTMIDSGSVGGSGSFLYDSLQDEFIFVHRGNGTNVTSSHFVTGPETYDNLGNELYLTCNVLTKGTGKEHLVDSCIFDNGTTTCIKNNLIGTGTISGTTMYGSTNVCSPIGLFSGCVGIGATSPTGQLHICGSDPALRIQSTVSGNIQMGQWDGTNNRIQASGRDFLITVQDSYNMLFNTNATERMRITSGGLVSINQTCGYGIFNVTGIDCSWGEGIIMNPAPNGYSAINFRLEGRTGSCFTGTWQLGKASSAESAAGELFSLNKAGLTGGLAGRPDASQQWKTNGDSIFGFNVGIGTCTPSRPLTVYSCTNGGSMGTGCTFLENAYFGNGGLTIGQESGTLNIALMTNSNKDIIFGGWNGTTNAERMRITIGGSVGINTNSPTSNTGLTAKRPTGTGWIIDALNGSNVRMGGIYSTGGNNGQLYLGNSAGTETILLDSAGTSFFNGGNVLVGTNSTCKGLLRVAGNAEICKTLFFNGGDGLGGAIINTLAASACATPAYNLISMFGFNTMTNYGAYLFIHTGYNTVTTKNSTITGIVNNGANQTISILATTMDSGATAPSVHSTSNWCIAFCWPNPANSNTKFIALAG